MTKKEWDELYGEDSEKEVDYVQKLAEKEYKLRYGFADEYPVLTLIIMLIVVVIGIVAFFYISNYSFTGTY